MITGKGFYIWIISRCEGGNPQAIAAKAKEAGLSHVLIKVADGPYPYNVVNKVDLVPALAAELKAAGIQVWGWQYIYGSTPTNEAVTAIHRVQTLGLDGFVVNAEAEFKKAGRAETAKAYMKILRAGIPDKPVALSSYRYPSYHPEFPFRAFLDRCDLAMPQVYWMQSTNPAGQLARTLSEYKPFAKPVIPTGACFQERGWRPTAVEVKEFLQAVQDQHLAGCNFWEWGSARVSVQDGWNVVSNWAADPILTPQPEPEQPAQGLRARVLTSTLNVRSGPSLSAPVVGQLAGNQIITINQVRGVDAWGQIGAGQWVAIETVGRRWLEIL